MATAGPSQHQPQQLTGSVGTRFMRDLGLLVLSLAMVAIVAALGGWFTAQGVRTWYPTIAKPSWTPPSWLFGPVWSTLYVLIACAAWRIARYPHRLRTLALVWYAVHLVLQVAWSGFFFGLQSPGFAMLDMVALLVSGGIVTWMFAAIDRWAAWFLVPYLGWVCFAAALNATIWWMN